MSSPPLFALLSDSLRRGEPVTLATVVEGLGRGQKVLVGRQGIVGSTMGGSPLEAPVARDALHELTAGTNATMRYGSDGTAGEEVTVFLETFAPPPRMLVFGAVDFTAALTRVARILGFHVVVCDARAAFATEARFPEADEVTVDWPHRVVERAADSLGPRDAICVLTHDPKFDVPALLAALHTRVGYIGVLGSRRTQATRRDELLAAGASPGDLQRIRGPIGLDIGARTPEEAAVAICAEIVANRSGRLSASLSHTGGPIH